MFRMSGLRLGRVLGIPIELNPSWFIVLAFVSWTLSTQYFPQEFPGRPAWVDVASGVITALLFFGSIVTHELSHSLVARRFGLRVERVTLFLFGGVAELSEEPHSPRTELAMALAGPGMSVALSAAFYAGYTALVAAGAPDAIWAPVVTLSAVNASVAVFNLAPGFPMDGGRVLRAFLWWATGDRMRATRAASLSGQAVGLALAGAGVWTLVQGGIDGAWFVLLGLFLVALASRAYRGQAARLRFAGTPVCAVMASADPIPVADVRPGSLIDARESLESAVRRFVQTGADALIVVADGRAVGRLARSAVVARP